MAQYVIEREIPGAGSLSEQTASAVREHAELGGFPANVIARVSAVIDPTTGN
jgi:hypothetical protein